MDSVRQLLAGAALAAACLSSSAAVLFLPLTSDAAGGPGQLGVAPTAEGGLVASTRGTKASVTAACGGTGPLGSAGLVVHTIEESLHIAPEGAVDGRLRARMTQPDSGRQWQLDAFVTGTAICLPGADGGCRPLAIRASAVGSGIVQGEPPSQLQFELRLLRVGTATQWKSELATVRLTGSPTLLQEILAGLAPAACEGPLYPAAWEQ